MRLRSCDQHPKYVGGCEPCNARSRVYENRRWYAAQNGQRLSTGAGQVTVWLQELRAAGYRLTDLATHSGMHFKAIYRLSVGGSEWVQLRTFHAVQKMYVELAPFPGPSRRAAIDAAKHGWTPPVPPPAPEYDGQSVDWVVVERLCEGQPIADATRAEKVAAWDLLGQRGMNVKQREKFLHTGVRNVEGWRNNECRPWTRRQKTSA